MRSHSAVSTAERAATYMPDWAPPKTPARRISSYRRWTSSGLLPSSILPKRLTSSYVPVVASTPSPQPQMSWFVWIFTNSRLPPRT